MYRVRFAVAVPVSTGATSRPSIRVDSGFLVIATSAPAVIGGEGNGGVIYPEFHSGRDALVAAAFVLSALARQNEKMSEFAETFNKYYTIKTKATLPPDFSERLKKFEGDAKTFVPNPSFNNIDGLRVDFPEGWVLIRSSNTEPIFRVMVETNQQSLSENLSKQVMEYFSG